MTAAQIKRLHTLLAKTETLQRQIKDDDVRSAINAAKEELFRALDRAQG